MSVSEEQGGLGLAVVVVDTYCDIAGEHHALDWLCVVTCLDVCCTVDELAAGAGRHPSI
jgi:hypothetical protein